MARQLILETSYLIDLEREIRRDAPGYATALLEQEAESILCITFTIAGEMAAGASLQERARWREFLAPYRMLGCTADVCWRYGEIYRFLKEKGALVGANDLWIAATAVAHGMPLVTHNIGHFERVPDLEIVSYR